MVLQVQQKIKTRTTGKIRPGNFLIFSFQEIQDPKLSPLRKVGDLPTGDTIQIAQEHGRVIREAV